MHPRQANATLDDVGIGSPAAVAAGYGQGTLVVNAVTADPSGVLGTAEGMATGAVTDAANKTTFAIQGQTVSVGALLQVTKMDPATVLASGKAAVTATLSQIGSGAQAVWDAQTTAAANTAREIQGAVDAIDLANHGINMRDPASEAKLAGVIAAGLSVVPGVGPILGAAFTLWFA